MWVLDDLLGIERGANEYWEGEVEVEPYQVGPVSKGNHFTEEGLETLRLSRLGKRGGGNSKKVEWNGKEYESIAAMARDLGLSRNGALHRLRVRDGTYVDKRPRKRSK